MRIRPLLALFTAVLALILGTTAAPAAAATTTWERVPLQLTNPSPTMTVAELERVAEQSAGRPLPPFARAVVFTTTSTIGQDAAIQSVLAGSPAPGIRIHKDAPTTPATTLGGITAGTPVPQGVIPVPIPMCRGSICVIIIVLFPS
jgi:hypothetical protein